MKLQGASAQIPSLMAAIAIEAKLKSAKLIEDHP
jgi:hypothetical protein